MVPQFAFSVIESPACKKTEKEEGFLSAVFLALKKSGRLQEFLAIQVLVACDSKKNKKDREVELRVEKTVQLPEFRHKLFGDTTAPIPNIETIKRNVKAEFSVDIEVFHPDNILSSHPDPRQQKVFIYCNAQGSYFVGFPVPVAIKKTEEQIENYRKTSHALPRRKADFLEAVLAQQAESQRSTFQDVINDLKNSEDFRATPAIWQRGFFSHKTHDLLQRLEQLDAMDCT